MKKAFILALSIFFIFAPRVYAAHDEVTLSMHLEDELKPEKAFDIYLSVVSEYEIGCCRIGFSYSESELELKNISAEKIDEVRAAADHSHHACGPLVKVWRTLGKRACYCWR